jgi:hypothetical protein
MLGPSEIHEIAKTLITDGVLLKNQTKFISSLNLRENFDQSIKNFQVGYITAYTLFGDVIRQWVSEKGENATVDGLCKILKDEEFNAAAGIYF